MEIGGAAHRLNGRGQRFSTVGQEPVAAEQCALICSPQDVIPRRTMPETAQQHCQKRLK